MKRRTLFVGWTTAIATVLAPMAIWASSHREAPFITRNPKVDGADFYIFNSYESVAAGGQNRLGYVTILANYGPLQDAYGGPNFFSFDPDAIYEIHVDNNGDKVEDLTFQFDFNSALANGGSGLALAVGPAASQKSIAVPFSNIGVVTAADSSKQNVLDTYQVKLIRGGRRTGTATAIAQSGSGATTFKKPMDNIGAKTFSGAGGYAAYASSFIVEIDVPGCTPTGVAAGTKARMFVGQRAEGFAVNLGQIFDLVNFNTTGDGGLANVVGAADQGKNIVGDKNISTIALEIPASCLTAGSQPIIGAWTTASVRQARVINPTPTFTQPSREGGPFAQVSRLGMPLVNEVVIGLKDKDKFNASEPKDDLANFADYVTNPTLPEVLEILFGSINVVAPNNFPRADLVTAFVTGVPGVNANGAVCEYVRLNTTTSTVFAPRAAADQSPLGAATCFDPPTATTDAVLNPARAGCDPTGFPNGRRPGDDVVDIELRVALGFLVNTNAAPAGQVAVVDGAQLTATAFQSTFPYLNTPFGGSP